MREPLDLPLPALLGALLFAAIVLAAVFARLAGSFRLRQRQQMARARSLRAVRGEHRSEALLARAGFVILSRQPRLSFALSVDGSPRAVQLRADWLVERGGRRFVADTKTGACAPSLDHAPTRRQLLEYRVAYDVDGVLLIDAETERIHEIVFPALLRPSGTPSRALLFVTAASIATVVALLLR